MDFRHLLTFQAIVKYGSFARAADELQYAQSTVTLHVQQLEAELGVVLFSRYGKRVILTEAGRTLGEQAGDILSQMEVLRQSMQALECGQAGQVRVGCIEPAAGKRLSPLLVSFCDERPRVRLTVEVAGTESISTRVASGDLDFGICSPPPGSLGLRYEPLFREPMGLLVPANHPLAKKEAIEPGDLNGVRLLLTEPNCAYRQLVERTLFEQGAGPYMGVEIGSNAALVWAVQSGLGVALVPAAAVLPTPPDGTGLRQIEGVSLALPIGVVTRQDERTHGRAARDLLDLVRTRLAANTNGYLAAR